ncbi:MAG: hypothetical protein QM582_09530 [Micropruina sp.]|uniref:hypothetical protein n=1 Tax=Micropruina sp. TaxID=2737536 RepID=UPI0039E538D8
MAQPNVTTAAAVADVLKTPATAPRFVAAYKAAEAATRKRCRWPYADSDGDPIPAPDDLVQAVILRTGRYMARANSPDGLVGMGDLGMMRVSSVDRDIERLEAPWRPVVFG